MTVVAVAVIRFPTATIETHDETPLFVVALASA
jgi:hypothetical protein